MTEPSQQQAPLPWYRQFWPWFLMALPAAVVVAGITTLVIALRHGDSLVSDNYYRDGLAINKVIAQDQRARELGLEAVVEVSADGQLNIRLYSGAAVSGASTAVPEALTLQLLHPASAESDRHLIVLAASPGRYLGELPPLNAHRYYLRLLPGTLSDRSARHGADWRLQGVVEFGAAQTLRLSPPADI